MLKTIVKIITFAAILLAGTAQAGSFQICTGKYALCAASTCQPTGKTITVHTSSGGSAEFPEYDCTCPVLNGKAIADLNGGNMQGSCAPADKTQVWSLFAPRDHFPQAITDWKRTPTATTATFQQCAASLNLGAQMVNCFSMACTKSKNIHGVETAVCHCPVGESLSGQPLAAATAFATEAGQGDPSYCSKYPVGGPLP